MPRQIRQLSKTNIYHIMIRGNEKKDIFLDDDDRDRFIDTLRTKHIESGFSIYGYCLMNNHVHLLINEGREGIAKVMKRINVSYAYYFNKKYNRIGHLFQDRFRSEVIEDTQYLLTALRYIHINPIKAELVEQPAEYKWSSYCLYMKGNINGLVDCKLVLEIISRDINKAISKLSAYHESWDVGCSFLNSFIDDIDRKIKEEQTLNRLISEYLGLEKVDLALLKERENRVLRDELIIKLSHEGKISVRKIAKRIGVNRGVVHTVLKMNG